ncbi:MAG: histidinol-phosphate transaminase [Candidatus Omnitrophica bacterium]|nr:histidinol-phosphate transaminase [Candidatus Omnitrophota bacterium]
MPKSRKYLKNLFRTEEAPVSRKGYLRLDMNENPSGLPEDFIRKVFSEATPDMISRYPEYRGLIKKIANHNGLKPENICLSNGSDAAIKYLFEAYIAPGDKVLLTDPVFAMYPVYCKLFQAKPVFAKYESISAFPIESFMRCLRGNIKMAVIVNPNNPTGSIIPKVQLLNIIKYCALHNILLVIDEAYFYYYAGTAIKEVSRFSNLVILRTFSKLCAMASVRIGYAAADPGIINNLLKVRSSYDINGIGVFLAEKLLDSRRLIPVLVKKADTGKAYLEEQLQKKCIEYNSGYANFLLINCGKRSDKIAAALAKKRILVQGNFTPAFLNGFIRVTAGDKEEMQRFWMAFKDIWKGEDD